MPKYANICKRILKKILEVHTGGLQNPSKTLQNLRIPFKNVIPTETTRHGAPCKYPAANAEKSPCHGPQICTQNWGRDYSQSLHPQNLRFKDPKWRTMRIVGTNLLQYQHAMAGCTLVGLARWERRLRHNVCVLCVTKIMKLKWTMQNAPRVFFVRCNRWLPWNVRQNVRQYLITKSSFRIDPGSTMVSHMLTRVTRQKTVSAKRKLLPHLSSSIELSRALQEEGKPQLTLVYPRPRRKRKL